MAKDSANHKEYDLWGKVSLISSDGVMLHRFAFLCSAYLSPKSAADMDAFVRQEGELFSKMISDKADLRGKTRIEFDMFFGDNGEEARVSIGGEYFWDVPAKGIESAKEAVNNWMTDFVEKMSEKMEELCFAGA